VETLSITVRYRPVRIGFCVRKDDFAAVRHAWRLSNSFWGGRYNPVLIVDYPDLARRLVNTFRVDMLWAASDDATTKAFVESFSYLPNPFSFHTALFESRSNGEREPLLLDLHHPIHSFYEDHIRNNPAPTRSVVIYEWGDDDPLSDVFVISPGMVASPEIAGTDYLKTVEHALKALRIVLDDHAPFPVGTDNQCTLSALGRLHIKRHHSVQNWWDYPGFFYGNAANFDDLVTFWNLRATDNHVVFYDPIHEGRFQGIREKWVEVLRGQPARRHEGGPRVAIWSRTRDESRDLSAFGKGLTICTIDDGTWGGMNLKAPFMYYAEGSALAAVSDRDDRPQISFQLPPKPVADTAGLYSQHMVISVEPGIGLFGNERATLETPYVPELNEFYGREFYFEWDKARVEPESLGIISPVTRDDLTLHALDVQVLIQKLFAVAGLKAEPSSPGLIAKRLITQMGGIDGCRVFKIKGVRDLIGAFKPEKAFTRSTATQIIRAHDAATGTIGFAAYENLFIERRPLGQKLKPDTVFAFLLKKRMFQAGLEFVCPNCQLAFWVSLDHVRTDTVCEYCGGQFNVTPYLRDRDWRYRRSGLLGRDDNQEGAVPVVLTIQQLHRGLFTRDVLYTTATKVTSGGTQIRDCETDFVMVVPRNREGRVEIVIGECKSRKPIEDHDVENLTKVAEAFPRDRFDVFVVLSKLTPFSDAEIESAKKLNSRYRKRAILLTDRELEPYFIYERTAQEFEIAKSASSFEDMARVTHEIYFSEQSPRKGRPPDA